MADGTRFGRIYTGGMSWEYMVREFEVEMSDKLLLLEEFLNVSGADGWELVGIGTSPTPTFTHVVYMKRGRSEFAGGVPVE